MVMFVKLLGSRLLYSVLVNKVSRGRNMSTAKIVLLIVMFKSIRCAQQEKCDKLEIPYLKNDTIDISENDYLNLTFWLNASQCEMFDTLYTLTMKIHTVTKSLDQDERIQITNNSCTPTKSIRCISSNGPVEIFRKVNRSHDEIEWKWRWKYNQSFVEHSKAVKLNVRYLPRVTKLTVNGEEVRGNNTLINEGQAVSVTCFFDKGNPSSTFRLYHAHGNKTAVGDESNITYSFGVTRCEQAWPVVWCEGQESTENRSLYFLVKCAPQFTDLSPKLINSVINGQVILNIKAHTSLVSGCVLTHTPLRQNSSRERNCSLLGTPPNLSLVLHLENAHDLTQGNWSLTVTNSIGLGKIDLIFVNASANEKENKTSYIVFIAGLLCGAVLLIIIAVAVAVAFAVIWRIRKQRSYISRASIDNARENAGLTYVVAPARDSQESPFSHPHQGPALSLQRGTATTLELLDSPSHSEYQNSQTNCGETVSINKYKLSSGESSDPSTATETMEMASTSGRRSTYGLIYGDLEMSSARTDVIIGSGSTTEYATIHLTAINNNDEDASH